MKGSSNMSIKTEKNKENKNIFNDNINKETKHISIKSNIISINIKIYLN